MTGLYAQSCKALYSYGAQFETVTFVNQSSAVNPHYYWNFGDGTSSYLENPTHEYPGNGFYLVTLYVHDLNTDKSDYYEMWLTITKNYTDPCKPWVTDSLFIDGNGVDYLKIIDLSSNCNGYQKYYLSAGGNNQSLYYPLGKRHGNYLTYIAAITSNSSQLYGIKTSPFKYDRSKNYQDCSANFEFSVLSEDSNGQRIMFSAMNKKAKAYNWIFPGFGDPIYAHTDTVSVIYPCYPQADLYSKLPWAMLKTVGVNGCVDSIHQEIACLPISNTHVGIRQDYFNQNNLKLSPNPVKEVLKLESTSLPSKQYTLELQNSFGQILGVWNYSGAIFELNMNEFTSGLYLIRIRNSETQGVFKVIKD